MKRGLVLLFLVVCVGGVAYLLLHGTQERAPRRGGVPAGEGRTDGGEAYVHAEAAEAAKQAEWERRWALDDDPNRVPGPPVTITGVVVRGERPVAGADVALHRARPRLRATAYQHERGLLDDSPVRMAQAKCDGEGRFSFRIPRRLELMVFASAPGAAFAWKRLLIPPEGDPPEIRIDLGEGLAIVGRVVDEDQQPVADVAVSASSNDWRAARYRWETTTNAEGLFRFDSLRAGGVWVAVEPAGYPSQRRYVGLPAASDLLFLLVKGGAVVGRVANDAGEPVAGARLLVQTGEAWGSETGDAKTLTDINGEYRIERALPGPLREIVIEHEAYGLRSSRQGDIVPPTGLVKVGQELRFDITLPRGVSVRGIVVESGGGTPVEGADIKLLRMTTRYTSLADVGVTRSDEGGRFEFLHVREGTYGLEAQAAYLMRRAQRSSNNKQPLTIDFFVDGKSPPEEQRIELEPVGAVHGRFEGVDSQQYPSLSVNLSVGDTNMGAQVDSFGAFEFSHVPPTPVTTLRSWNPNVTSGPFAVLAGETTEVILDAKDQGGFTGVVEDEEGNPMVGATVRAMPEGDVKNQVRSLIQSHQWGSTRTDAQGRFQIAISDWQRENQANQKWIVAAIHLEHELAMSEAMAMPEAGQSTEVELQLAKGGTITGRVEMEGGGPLPNVTVHANPRAEKGQPYESRPSRSDVSGLDGTFEIRGVASGDYHLSAWSALGTAGGQTVKAGDTDVKLVFVATESISGFVLDEDGQPIAQGHASAMIPTAKGERQHRGNINQGRFRILGLQPGSYEIVVEPQNRRSRGRAPVFEKKRVGPVSTGTQDLVIEVSWGNKLAGRVLGPGGRAVGGLAVVAMTVKVPKRQRRRREARPMAITNGRGEFTLKGLGPEEVELLVSGAGYQPVTSKATPGGGSVTIHIEKGETIEGRVFQPDGRPLANQWFNVRPLSKELQARFNSWNRRAGQNVGYMAGYNSLNGRTDGQGNFKLGSLYPGEYRLWLRSPKGVAPDMTLQTGTLNVLIQLEPALTIRGVVTTADGSPPVTQGRNRLYISARQGKKWLSGAQLALDGSFEIKSLPAGPVTLQVWGSGKYKTTTLDTAAGDQSVRMVLNEK